MGPQRTIEDRTAKINREFDWRKTYPHGNGFSWDEFLSSQRGKTGLFMLVIERQLGHQEVAFDAHREKLFGVCADRIDGKLGKICFGWATTDFGGAEKPYEKIFSVDGYDPKFLHTRDVSCDGDHKFLNMPHKQYKIVEVIDSEEVVATEIVRFTHRFIPSDMLTKEQAEVLISIGDQLACILDEVENGSIKSLWQEVKKKIRERWSFLQEENEGLQTRIRMNEEEMFTLAV